MNRLDIEDAIVAYTPGPTGSPGRISSMGGVFSEGHG